MLELFNEGTRAIISTWPALKLAIQQNADQCNPDSIKENLCNEICDYFKDHGANIDVEDMEDFFAAFFNDVFDVTLEDGSLEKFSLLFVQLFQELSQGVPDLYSFAISEAQRTAGIQVPAQVIQQESQEDLEDATEDEEMVEMTSAPQKPSTEIDEDGLEWTIVQKGKRKP